MESWLQQATAIAPEPARAVEEARVVLDSIRSLEPLEGELAEAASAVREILEISDPTARSAEPTGADGTVDGLEDALARLREVATFPPEGLLDAARAFIAGDYSHVIEDLVDAEAIDDRERAHTHLLLAASRFALYVIGERSDDSLLELARSDTLAVRSAQPDLEPTLELFSPSFVEFFEAVGP